MKFMALSGAVTRRLRAGASATASIKTRGAFQSFITSEEALAEEVEARRKTPGPFGGGRAVAADDGRRWRSDPLVGLDIRVSRCALRLLAVPALATALSVLCARDRGEWWTGARSNRASSSISRVIGCRQGGYGKLYSDEGQNDRRRLGAKLAEFCESRRGFY